MWERRLAFTRHHRRALLKLFYRIALFSFILRQLQAVRNEHAIGNVYESSRCPGTSIMRCRGDINMIWSLSFTTGATPLLANFSRGPIQRGLDVTDISALFVADPFLVVDKEAYHIFSEVLNQRYQKGEIGHHVSYDSGTTWRYDKIVLAEAWHLSFPFVLKFNGKWYMTTSATAGTKSPYSLWLYVAESFPHTWVRRKHILLPGQLNGRAVDPVISFHENTWYIFVLDDGLDRERLYFSDSLLGKFTEHPKSGKFTIRQSGQHVTDLEGRIWAFHHSSATVERLELLQLSRTEYEYGPKIPFLGPREDYWASSGMHTYNAVQTGLGTWAAVTDGWWNDISFDTYLASV